ncbi:hypothetical protein ACIPL1_27820 [Pseudomonas sp. NPDC090202]|uniref:hypothetical protein n=1 Tax=Pseudomonas sp. NPDC090202 TaxID=3364476 RepID=UPI0038135693
MQMSDAVEVIEVHGQAEANKHLRAGWKLLTVLRATTNSGLSGTTYGIYVMGKPEPAQASAGWTKESIG